MYFNKKFNHGLKTVRLKEFRRDAKSHFEVWKKNNEYFVAINVAFINGEKYAQETIPCKDNLDLAKKICDESRRNYILFRVENMRKFKKVY